MLRNRKRDIQILTGSGILDYIKNIFTSNSQYTNSSNSVLKQYGNLPIIGIQVRRQPILKILDTVLKVISLGSFDTKKYGGYDKMYHLFMVVTIKTTTGNKDIVIEKNQSINISTTIPNVTPQTERLTIALPSKINYTINNMLEKTLNNVGSNQYFVYDAFTNNCQRYITDILKNNGLLGDRYSSWILQDITELTKQLPSYVKIFSKGLTDVASMGEKLIGKGKIKFTNSNYLKFVKLLAVLYGYNPKNIKLANDGKYKLTIKHDGKLIKFGKAGQNDFIIYFLKNNDVLALKRRELYLKRSGKIKGNWKDNMFSKNNLSRNLLWFAPKITGGSFNNIKEDLNKIGNGNQINDVVENSISDFELKKYLPNANIIMYPDLKNYATIEELLPNNKDYIILLYLQDVNNGHWVSLKRNKNIIEFFCSYGSKIDESLTWNTKQLNIKLGQSIPYLSNLLNKTKLHVLYNDVDYQNNNHDIVTCGRHVIFNLMNFLRDGVNLNKYYKLMLNLKKTENLSYDEIVSKYVNLILD